MSEPGKFSTPSLPVRMLYAVRAAAVNPALLVELARKFLNRTLTAERHASRLAEYGAFEVSEVQAIAVATGASDAQIRDVLAEPALARVTAECLALAGEKQVGQFTWGGFAEVCYAICRLNRPSVALETGVAFGWTSAFILAALDANSHGHLYSVDLPAFRPGASEITGAVVPPRLHGRWTLTLGSQTTVVPRLLSSLDTVDFFHYDSDKTYQGMQWGYGVLWPKIPSGGVLMSDDVDNDALLEFAEGKRERLAVIVKPIDGQRVALMRRSGSVI